MEERSSQNPRYAVQTFVAGRIHGIQEDYLSPTRRSVGARKLAALRHAATKEPGSTPDTWGIEFESMPAQLAGRFDWPSVGEYAVHGALTLYAIHQQSQSAEMCVLGWEHNLGAAIRQMIDGDPTRYESLQSGELPRRFAALVTAESFSEVMHYARQLVQQLRTASIPLDYGLLAQQLYDLQNPYRADTVRLSWGRAFARVSFDATAKQEENKER